MFFSCSMAVQAGMLFSCEGIWRRLWSNLTLQPWWNMTQGWMEAFRLVSVFPHVVLLFFICLSPNKTRTALSDTHTLSEQTRFCQSHSLPLLLFLKQVLYWCFYMFWLFFFNHTWKQSQDVTDDAINFKSAVCADYTSLWENVICRVSKRLFFSLVKAMNQSKTERRTGNVRECNRITPA